MVGASIWVVIFIAALSTGASSLNALLAATLIVAVGWATVKTVLDEGSHR